ncbi:MAG: T9SS type A sorting domain-containing protein, partial [Flavobacteriales bacterium]|nr:T9SS type A sorting domain-containing protein [Flavobacteriales bacterium]
KNGLTPGTSYRASSRTWCNPAGGRYKASAWTPFIFWTQPTTIRLEGGNTAITNLDVYPNPSRDIFNVTFETLEKQDLEISIVNLLGEVILRDKKTEFLGEYTKEFDLNTYPKGVYLLEIETNDDVVNKKLILQ